MQDLETLKLRLKHMDALAKTTSISPESIKQYEAEIAKVQEEVNALTTASILNSK